MREQVVMITADVPADRSRKRMRFVFRPIAGAVMVRMVQRFGDDIALKRDVSRVARTRPFVRTPTNRAMIHNAMIATAQPRAIHCFAGGIADPETKESNDDIMRAECA